MTGAYVVSDISCSLDPDWTKSANWDINLRFKIWSRDLILVRFNLWMQTTNERLAFDQNDQSKNLHFTLQQDPEFSSNL